MRDIFVEFTDMYLIRSGSREEFSVSISAPRKTCEQDFSCEVVFTSNEPKSQTIFGVDSGDCLKLALVYVMNILENPLSHLGGKVCSSDGSEELPIIRVKTDSKAR